ITERKQAEEALSVRERTYRTLAENLPGIVYRVHIREKDRMQFFNNILVTMTGYNEKELIEGEVCSIDPLIVAEDRDRVIAEVNAAIKDNRSFSIEYRITHKDGTSRFFFERGRPIFGNDELHCIDGVILDITERKRAEEALRESEEKYRNLVENAAEAIYVAQDGKLVFLNPMTAMMSGYSGEELMARPFTEFVHPDDRDMVIDRHVRRIKGEELPHIYSFRIIHRDGNIRWVELNTVLINWKGKPATLNFLSNITERRQAELKLKESEEIMRYIIKHDPNAIAVYDRNLQYIAVSNRYLQDYNVKESDIIGKHHYEVFPEMPQKWKDVHLRCLAGAIERNDDDYFERPDGSITYNSWECRPWHRSDGEIGGIITYTEVTTERKKSEEELRTSRSQLRALAARLQQIREYERIMIAREIHDEMGGGLTGLKMDLSWLLRKMSDADPGEARVALMDKIHTSNALIDQMIHVVRRISTDLRPSVLDDLGLIAALEWQLSEFTSRTEIPHEFATTIEYVNMEENTAIAVFRIFQEALTNVARHSRATKVAVILREGERSLFGDKSLVLEIRDNGRGITEEEILNPESLGLLGMKERVLAFEGELSIRGEPGGGTALVLQIPRKQGEVS
ncbi:MAG: PAS domain S-box protein, partial [Desulfobacterales bacterium]|nr:PAS domain S-box protein [Desulfobacterales bacterium]